MADPADLPAALAAFEATLDEDLGAGRAGTAAEYAARFPGFEAHIERAYQRRVRQQGGGREVVAAFDEPFTPGTLLGSYRLEREIGRGGQGAVFVAEDTRVRRRVAIKVLDRLGAVPADTMRRFAREAAIVARLDHPALSALFDMGEHAGTPFLVMRYVEGETLAQWVRRARDGNGWLAPATSASQVASRCAAILTLTESIARALHAAHEAGVVHRDVKPGNLMLTPEGTPVVLDFGLALDERDEGLTLTRSGDFLGTPSYMAPEQLVSTSAPIDRRADVWALGVVLYECLTLRRPFTAPTTAGLSNAVLHDPVPSTRSARVPRDLETVIATALERDRSRRYQSALELADDLGRVLRHEPIHARPASAWRRGRRWVKRHPVRTALAVLAVFMLATLAATAGFLAARRPLLELGEEAARLDRRESALSEAYFATFEGDPAPAAEVFRRVLTEDPADAEALAGLALSRRRTMGKTAALAVLDERATLVRDHAALRRLHAFLSGSPGDAQPLSPADPALDYFVGGLLELERMRDTVDRKLAEKAADLLTAAIVRCRTARPLYFVLRARAAGFTRWRADLVRETAAILENNWPDRPSASYWAGVAWKDVDPVRATACFQRAWEREPDNERGARELCFQLAATGKDTEALALSEELVRRWPLLATRHLALAKVHEVARRHDRALAAAEAATRLDPRLRESYVMRATACLAKGDHAAARTILQECLRVNPGYSIALAVLAGIEGDTGDADESLALSEEALRSDPFQPQVWWNFGGQLVIVGRVHEGHAALAKALQLGSGMRWVPAGAAKQVEAIARDTQRFDARLARLQGDAARAEDEGTLHLLAEAAAFRQQWALAASLWARALEAAGVEPAAPGTSRRTRAARCAAATEDAAWRERARAWLSADYSEWEAAQQSGALDLERQRRRVFRWQQDPVLNAVLPEAARQVTR